MNEAILTSIDKQAFLKSLDADPEWAYEVLNRLLKRSERAETFREWLGINELARAVQDLAEAQRRTEQKVQELAEAQQRTDERVNNLVSAVERLEEAQRRTEQQVQTLAEAQQRTEQKVQELAEAQQRTEQQVQTLADNIRGLAQKVSVLSDILGPTWEEEARESVAFLLPKAGVRLLTPLESQPANEWDGVAKAEWEGRSIQVRMEAKVSAAAGRIQNFANKVKALVAETGLEIMPIFCGIRLYAGAREEAQRQKIVLVGLREIRNEIPPPVFTIRPQDV
ncbi:MAG: hypothetical protein ACE5PV_19755 [Candidatus Poribacteria bacterium]